jgi:hypothetical protein
VAIPVPNLLKILKEKKFSSDNYKIKENPELGL